MSGFRDVLFLGALAAAVSLALTSAVSPSWSTILFRLPVGVDLGPGVHLRELVLEPLDSNRYAVTVHYEPRPWPGGEGDLGLVLHNAPTDPRNVPAQHAERGYEWLDFTPELQPRYWRAPYDRRVELTFPQPADRTTELRFGVWDHRAGAMAGPSHTLQIDFGQVDLGSGGSYASRMESTAATEIRFVALFAVVWVLLVLGARLRDRRVEQGDWGYAVRV